MSDASTRFARSARISARRDALAGQREPKDVQAAFPALTRAMPQTRTWVAPGMRHIWSIQDPVLFTRRIVDFVDRDVVPG
ncbi:hypothetical protein [Microbacterium sp. SA39]|uniref:hypothetical protein n=1 Tax=Microbacterium sp. SA39 TaxID=1263625 RepID=UPI0005F9F2AD|nr:hypothetical protein [Microbacterium sp. SA39]